MENGQNRTVLKSKNEVIKVTQELYERFGVPEYDYSKHQLQWEGTDGSAKMRLPITAVVSGETKISWNDDLIYLILIIQTGMATVGVFKGSECLLHKVFSSYMVRKKQGKSQIKYLKTKGKSRAGSRVRLASGLEFFEGINERLQSHFAEHEFDRILFSCSKILLPLLFKSKVNTPFTHNDARVLGIPRHIPKATNEEMLRTQRFMNYAELTMLEPDTFEVDLY